MIRSFKDPDCEACFEGRAVRTGWQDVQRVAQRKLLALHAAVNLRDLMSPPGNHLEALTGDRAGQHSIRVNEKWRVCFAWNEDGPHQVEIVDYH